MMVHGEVGWAKERSRAGRARGIGVGAGGVSEWLIRIVLLYWVVAGVPQH